MHVVDLAARGRGQVDGVARFHGAGPVADEDLDARRPAGHLGETEVDARAARAEDGGEEDRRVAGAARRSREDRGDQKAVRASSGRRRLRPARDDDVRRGRDPDRTEARRPERVADDVGQRAGRAGRDAEADGDARAGRLSGRVVRERDVNRDLVGVEEDEVGREERAVAPGAPHDRRQQLGERSGHAGLLRRLRLDEERPARQAAVRKARVVLEAERPAAGRGAAGEEGERLAALDGPPDHLAEDRALPVEAVDEPDRRPVGGREGGPHRGEARVLEREGGGDRRDVPGEEGRVGPADQRPRLAVRGLDELARTGRGPRRDERRPGVEARRRERAAGVGDGDARHAEEVGREEGVGERGELPGEEESAGSGRRRGGSAGERGPPPSSRLGRDPADPRRQQRERGPPVARARDHVGAGHGVRAGRAPLPRRRALARRVDHPDADHVGVAGGPGQRLGVPGVPRGGDDGEARLARAGEDARGDRVGGVAEAGPHLVVGEAHVQDVEAERFPPFERPIDGGQDVRGERGRAPAPRAEDLQGDDRGARRHPLLAGGDSGDGGPVSVAVEEVRVAVREVPPADDAATALRGRAEVGVEEVDSGVDEPDRPPGPRQAGHEEPVDPDLRGPDLARGSYGAVEDDGARLAVRGEPGEPLGGRPAGEDLPARKGTDRLEPGRRGSGAVRVPGDQDADPTLGLQAVQDADAHPGPGLPRRNRERGRGEGRGGEQGAWGAGTSHAAERKLPPGTGRKREARQRTAPGRSVRGR